MRLFTLPLFLVEPLPQRGSADGATNNESKTTKCFCPRACQNQVLVRKALITTETPCYVHDRLHKMR